jgi:hypothetical protein
MGGAGALMRSGIGSRGGRTRTRRPTSGTAQSGSTGARSRTAGVHKRSAATASRWPWCSSRDRTVSASRSAVFRQIRRDVGAPPDPGPSIPTLFVPTARRQHPADTDDDNDVFVHVDSWEVNRWQGLRALDRRGVGSARSARNVCIRTEADVNRFRCGAGLLTVLASSALLMCSGRRGGRQRFDDAHLAAAFEHHPGSTPITRTRAPSATKQLFDTRARRHRDRNRSHDHCSHPRAHRDAERARLRRFGDAPPKTLKPYKPRATTPTDVQI